jgi:DNA-binding NtrC family response regulator
MRNVIARCKQLAATDVPGLLVGESGVGRLTLAQGIHFAGSRKAGPFEIFDAGSISANLLEGELVGRGQWLGTSVQGILSRANGGTLYITEVCALPADLQGILLRAIELRSVRPIGAAQAVEADVRIIVSTDRDPQDAVSDGELRGDLFYALSVGRVDVPPLRERSADILGLAQRFVTDTCLRYGRREPLVSADFKRALLDCSWPGNVRQLRNVIEQVVLFAPERELTINDIPDEVILNRLRPKDPELNPDLIRSVLRRTRGHRGEAARLLGVGRSTLWRAMKQHGIP